VAPGNLDIFIQIVEGDLCPVNVQPSYDRHWGPLPAHVNNQCVQRHALERRGSPLHAIYPTQEGT